MYLHNYHFTLLFHISYIQFFCTHLRGLHKNWICKKKKKIHVVRQTFLLTLYVHPLLKTSEILLLQKLFWNAVCIQNYYVWIRLPQERCAAVGMKMQYFLLFNPFVRSMDFVVQYHGTLSVMHHNSEKMQLKCLSYKKTKQLKFLKRYYSNHLQAQMVNKFPQHTSVTIATVQQFSLQLQFKLVTLLLFYSTYMYRSMIYWIWNGTFFDTRSIFYHVLLFLKIQSSFTFLPIAPPQFCLCDG